jgi:hypothetical protein
MKVDIRNSINPIKIYKYTQYKVAYFANAKAASTSIIEWLGGFQKAQIVNSVSKIPSDYFRFSIVRNPYVKLASVYNFLVNVEKGGWELEFSDFVTFLRKIAKGIKNRHWVPQHLAVPLGEVHFIGKFEQIDEAFKHIKNKLNLIQKCPHLNRSNTSYISLYTTEARNLVYQHFKEDFKIFKYAP